MSRFAAATLIALLPLAPVGCTIRYSQTLVGSIERVAGRPITNSDSGIEIGLAPRAGIAFSEPTHSEELLKLPCEVAMTQVDYRGTWYAFYITANFPETETVSYCISD